MAERRLLLIDANVLIDYTESDLGIVTLVSHHLGQVYVLHEVLAEVEQLSASDCEEAAIEVLDPETEQLIEAGSQRGDLSFRDRLCLIVAKEEGLELVTNDKALRRHCHREEVAVVWGLGLMLELLERRRLKLGRALTVARKIHDTNSQHIGRRVVAEFERKARKAVGRP